MGRLHKAISDHTSSGRKTRSSTEFHTRGRVCWIKDRESRAVSDRSVNQIGKLRKVSGRAEHRLLHVGVIMDRQEAHSRALSERRSTKVSISDLGDRIMGSDSRGRDYEVDYVYFMRQG